jgi:cytochrome P450
MNESAALQTYPFRRTCPFDPPPQYAEMRAARPVTKVKLWDGSTTWLATGHAEVRRILADPRFSIVPTRPGFPFVAPSRASMLRGEKHNFAFTDAPDHTRHRRMLTRMFTIQNVAAMRPAIQDVVDHLLNEMGRKGSPGDLVNDFALPVPSHVIARLLGVPYGDHEFFQDCARTRVDLTVAPEVSLAAGDRIFAYLDRLLAEKERDPGNGEDLLSRLVIEQIRPGHLAHADAVGMARVLLLAGHDTTATMIADGALSLLQDPEQKEALCADPSLVGGAIEEMLRYWTIAHHNAPRVAMEDVEIAGEVIRIGEGVIASITAANRDPSVFPDPDRFDIRRSPNPHLAFAFGVHQCLGQALARLELEIVFATLFLRLPGLRLSVPLDQISYKHDSMTYGVHALPVAW